MTLQLCPHQATSFGSLSGPDLSSYQDLLSVPNLGFWKHHLRADAVHNKQTLAWGPRWLWAQGWLSIGQNFVSLFLILSCLARTFCHRNVAEAAKTRTAY
jgi:hypothetical protein